jgi:hypothetical protein
LAALDGIQEALLADLADIRAKMNDAWQWGVGGRLPSSAKLYRKSQQPKGHDTWWYNVDGPSEELGCVLHHVFDWITDSNEREVDIDDGMRGLQAAIEVHVRRHAALMSAACAAAGYDEGRLSDISESPRSPELHVGANVVDLEDARLSKDIAELGDAITKNGKEAGALRDDIYAMTKLVESWLPPRPRHLTLVVSNDEHQKR